MKKYLMGSIVAVAALVGATVAGAATFAGYTDIPTTQYFDGGATLIYQPGTGANLIDDGTGTIFVTGSVADDLSNPSLNLFDSNAFLETFDSGIVLDYSLDFDAAGDEVLSVLWDLRGRGFASDYGIMTFTGEFGFDSLANAVGFISEGTLSVIGASKDTVGVIPLPATLPLMLAGFGGFMAIRRRRS